MTPKQMGYRKQLIAKLHAIKARKRMSDDEYRAVLGSYDCASSKDMTIAQLFDCIQRLNDDRSMNVEDDMAIWRKRVFGAVSGWLTYVERPISGMIIKAIVCRAARVSLFQFDDIDKSVLIRIFNKFNKMREVLQNNRRLEANYRRHPEFFTWQGDKWVKTANAESVLKERKYADKVKYMREYMRKKRAEQNPK